MDPGHDVKILCLFPRQRRSGGKSIIHTAASMRKGSWLQRIDLFRQDNEIWELFTRKEEYDGCSRDCYDRFPYYRSRHRDIFVPRASEMLMENGYYCEYPDDQPFAICLTHDIDTVYRPLHSKVYEIVCALKHRDFAQAGCIVPQLCSKKRPEWNFSEIVDLEESYGACSSFYFLALEKGDEDYTYAIEDLEREMCKLQDRGWEIGLHGGGEAYRDSERLQREKRHLEKVLNRTVYGYRNHFLKFRVPDTWELLERAGFRYDTTLGYPDCVGFRNGMCHPFHPFNLNTNRRMEILEIPLTIMDQTLFSYMRLNMEQAWTLTKGLLETVEKHNGVITILWHNTYMTGAPLRFYSKILKYGRERGAWMTNCKEIETWWQKGGMRSPHEIQRHRSPPPFAYLSPDDISASLPVSPIIEGDLTVLSKQRVCEREHTPTIFTRLLQNKGSAAKGQKR